METANSRSPSAPVRYRFGPFELKASPLQLRRRGVRVPLSGQPLQILQILLENPHRAVSRDELRVALWPRDVHVDFDGALNTAVRKLRQALDDTAEKERYIQTLPRQGYQFAAAVDVEAPAEEPVPPSPESPAVAEALVPSAPQPAWRKPWLWAVVAASLLTGILAGTLLWRLAAPPSLISLTNRAYVTSYPGEQLHAAVSPDGGQVAFSWADPQQNGPPSLYVTSIDGLGLHRLTHADAKDSAPAWSPDGSLIAFIRDRGNSTGDVMVIPSAGGSERRIAFTEGSFTSWMPGGGAVLIAEPQADGRSSRLWSVSLATGERRAITEPGEPVDRWDRFGFSPDGAQLAYEGWPGKEGPAELYVRPAAGGAPRRVTWLPNGVHNWCWLPDSRSFAVVSDQPGAFRLFRVRMDALKPTPEPIEGAGDDTQYPVAFRSPGSDRLVFCQQRLISNIHRFALRRDSAGLPVALENPATVAPATRRTSNPQISPDGKLLTFVSNRSLFTEIWLSDADGGNAHPLTSFSSAGFIPGSPKWSPDGTKIVFTTLHAGSNDLYLVTANGGPVTQLTHGWFDAIRPSFSHDGKWIYFSRRDSSAEKLRLWKLPARADVRVEDPEPLAGKGSPEIYGMEPIESPEGGTVYYVPRQSGHELWSVSLAGGAPRRVISEGVRFGWWTPARGGVYYIDLTKTFLPDEPEHPPVWFFDSASGRSRQIGTLPERLSSLVYQPGISLYGDFLWTDWTETNTINLVRGDLK
jgi:Tol biopolymer transport system component/DNA-binding winged helix-turn-helix (wHTH) protein